VTAAAAVLLTACLLLALLALVVQSTALSFAVVARSPLSAEAVASTLAAAYSIIAFNLALLAVALAIELLASFDGGV
jgi:hypothetical protein